MVEELLLPWWKLPFYALALGLMVLSIRVAITFNMNDFLENRRQDKLNRYNLKRANQCSHCWTLFVDSPHSRCDFCNGLISTTLLLTMQQLALQEDDITHPMISGQVRGITIEPQEGGILVSDYIGKRED